jgi:hypothetical protein
MRARGWRVALAGLLLVASSAAFAQAPSDTPAEAAPTVRNNGEDAASGADNAARSSTLEQALAAYREAQETDDAIERRAAFARAERLFAAAIDEGPAGPELYTNLGAAALQAESLGAAVLGYRRALALDPDHRRARQNLLHARTLLPPWVPRPEGAGFFDGLLAWRNALSPAEARGVAALSFFAACGLAATALLTGSGALRLAILVPALAWALLLGSTLADDPDATAAVVVADDVVARAADSRNAPARFAEPLPAGTEVTIAEVRSEWTRLVLADGRDAWVPTASLARVDG